MKGKTILVVEDGATMRQYYRNVLEQAGYDVAEAANGLEGLERALINKPDMFVVDVNMPVMDGYEMIRRVRQEATLKMLPIMTISTEDQDQDAAKAFAAGGNFYLVKPASPDELVEAVDLMTGALR